MLSSVRKGRIGELKVMADLLNKGYDVYLPVVDDNGVDMIVSNGDKVKKVQCKSHDNPKKQFPTSVEINTRGCQKVDVIAIPLKAKQCICYIQAHRVQRAINIAFKKSISGQKLLRNWYQDFLEFPW